MFLRIARWVPANGIAFVILVVIAYVLTRDSPGGDASEAEIASYYADDGNLDAERISFFLIGLAAFCFLSFLGSLRGALHRAEGDPARLTTATTERRTSEEDYEPPAPETPRSEPPPARRGRTGEPGVPRAKPLVLAWILAVSVVLLMQQRPPAPPTP